MHLRFEAVAEAEPGRKWVGLFQRHWGAYKTWFTAADGSERASYLQSRKMMRQHMPELVQTYERLLELAGGSDVAARFLSLYRPPPYISGCSQAVWPDAQHPLLVRNYDYSPKLCEGTLMLTQWNGRRVMAMVDCLWGVLDGMNDAGLAVSLSFGGRRVNGDGFGMPVILRYVLEFCDTAIEAAAILQRIPTHMSYNITVLDRDGCFRTIFLSPDRAPVIRQLPVATNHQGHIEWREHAESTASLQREQFLFFRLADSEETERGFIKSFLRKPLYSKAYKRGFGTLYTSLYRPQYGEMELHWPDAVRRQSFDKFIEFTQVIRYAAAGGKQTSGQRED